MKYIFALSTVTLLLSGCSSIEQRNEVYSTEIHNIVNTAIDSDKANLKTVLSNSYIECDKFHNTCTAFSYHKSFISKSPVFFMKWSSLAPSIENVEFGYRLKYIDSDWLFINSAGFGSSDGFRFTDKISCRRAVTKKGNIIENCVSFLSKNELQKMIPIMTSNSNQMVRLSGSSQYYDLSDSEIEKYKQNLLWLKFMMSTAGNVILKKSQDTTAT